MYCTVCDNRMDITTTTRSGQHEIYVDAECNKCGAKYTGTIKKMSKPKENK